MKRFFMWWLFMKNIKSIFAVDILFVLNQIKFSKSHHSIRMKYKTLLVNDIQRANRLSHIKNKLSKISMCAEIVVRNNIVQI